MPGIIGIVTHNSDGEQLLEKMAGSVKHRPWQLVEKYSQPPFHIGRIHLGIFNPEPQPLFNEDKNLAIFMYGKIYGYEADLKELKTKHKLLLAQNDAEFCLHAYEEWGKGFVHKLNGSFVIAICDFRKNELVVINDRFGLSPLHYAVYDHKLAFASEVKAILQDSTFKRELDEAAIADFFALGSICGNRTLFRRISVLPPASILTYRDQSISIEPHWDMHYEPDYGASEEQLVDETIQALQKALALRMDGRLRYSISLSGGYDSRTLVAALGEKERANLIALTFGVPNCYDVTIAQAVARVAGTKPVDLLIDPDESLGSYPNEVVYFSDGMQTMHGSFVIPVYEKARQHLDVICEGLATGTTIGGRHINRTALSAKNNEQLIQILNGERLFSDTMMARLFHSELYNRIRDIPVQSIGNSLNPAITHPANRLDYYTLQNPFRRSMFVGSGPLIQNFVEMTIPTFDNDFFNVLLKIPPELRYRHRIYWKILKKLDPELARIPYEGTMLPADAPLWLWRPAYLYWAGKQRLSRYLYRFSGGRIFQPTKHNFAPVSDWLMTNASWRRFTTETLLDKNSLLKGFCRQGYIQKLVEEHESGRAYNFGQINQLITFELFLKMFFK